VIRIERDPAWWVGIASHPALIGALYGMPPAAIAPFVTNPNVLPLAAEHGGFLVMRLDAVGFVYDFHTLFTPEGWGREVAGAAKEAVFEVMARGARVLTTLQCRDNPRSKPPLSFGFAAVGDWAETQLGEARCWMLTREAWEGSPARKRMLS